MVTNVLSSYYFPVSDPYDPNVSQCNPYLLHVRRIYLKIMFKLFPKHLNYGEISNIHFNCLVNYFDDKLITKPLCKNCSLAIICLDLCVIYPFNIPLHDLILSVSKYYLKSLGLVLIWKQSFQVVPLSAFF